MQLLHYDSQTMAWRYAALCCWLWHIASFHFCYFFFTLMGIRSQKRRHVGFLVVFTILWLEMETLAPLTMTFAYLAFNSIFFTRRSWAGKSRFFVTGQWIHTSKIDHIIFWSRDSSMFFFVFFSIAGESLFPGFHFSTSFCYLAITSQPVCPAACCTA